jgi:hypothetical protein
LRLDTGPVAGLAGRSARTRTIRLSRYSATDREGQPKQSGSQNRASLIGTWTSRRWQPQRALPKDIDPSPLSCAANTPAETPCSVAFATSLTRAAGHRPRQVDADCSRGWPRTTATRLTGSERARSGSRCLPPGPDRYWSGGPAGSDEAFRPRPRF